LRFLRFPPPHFAFFASAFRFPGFISGELAFRLLRQLALRRAAWHVSPTCKQEPAAAASS